MKVKLQETDDYSTVIDSLIKASNDANLEVLKQLLKTVHVNAQDSKGRTALHMAAAKGDLHGKAVQSLTILVSSFLLSNGADCNINDLMGNTPLHLATIGGNSEIVSLMLNNSS